MSEIIARDLQKSTLASNEGIVTLYELEMIEAAGSTPATVYYFHDEKTFENLTFNGNTYLSFPVHIEGLEVRNDGPAPRPTMQIPNIESVLKDGSKLDPSPSDNTSNFLIEDLLGKRVTRRRTLEKYVGIGSASAEASGNLEFPSVTFVIDRIVSKTALSITLELASPFDLEGIKVPSRLVTSVYCPWVYKGYSAEIRDKRSACHWKSTSRINLSDGTEVNPFIFFTIDNEPLILRQLLTTGSPVHAPSWNSSGPATGEPQPNPDVPESAGKYTADMYVSYQGEIYQARQLVSDNTTPPAEGSVDWQLVRTYQPWTTDSNTTYLINSDDPRKNPYVYYQGQVYIAVRSSNSQGVPHKRPDISPAYWQIADVCGKLVESCKIRYQAIMYRPSTARGYNGTNRMVTPAATGNPSDNKQHAIPAQRYNNEIGLPFGGFPGVRRLNT